MGRNLFLLNLLILPALFQVNAVDYTVVDNSGDSPGGVRFRDEIGGADYSMQSLTAATDFIFGIFQQQNSPSDRKGVQKITLFLENGNGVAFATGNGEIHFNANYLAGLPAGSDGAKREFTGVIYHETTHVWQWNGNGRANGGLIEGIADYVRLKSGYAPGHWVGPGQGDRWDQGYDVTARFLEYCDGLRNGFVADLNKKMRNDYNDGFFSELLGKTVDELWRDYKAQYGQ